jgi:hypothetical protein
MAAVHQWSGEEVYMIDQRPKVTISFKYNLDTGEIEEFIIDDHAPAARESYHDQVALSVASRLVANPEIADAGPASSLSAGAVTGSQNNGERDESVHVEPVEE